MSFGFRVLSFGFYMLKPETHGIAGLHFVTPAMTDRFNPQNTLYIN